MSIRIGLAQINACVGDLEGNSRKILEYILRAQKAGCDLVLLPELAVAGYPPEDLLLRPQFLEQNIEAIEQIASQVGDITAVVGFADLVEDAYNAAAVLHEGVVEAVYHKRSLPNYGVFDEDRNFQKGCSSLVIDLGGRRLGVTICEDIWYPGGPAREEVLAGDAAVILNISASPYAQGKPEFRRRMLATRAQDNVAVVAFCNMVGGQDELVFDGNSCVLDQLGRRLACGPSFEEALITCDVDCDHVLRTRLKDPRWRADRRELEIDNVPAEIYIDRSEQDERGPADPGLIDVRDDPNEEVYKALVLGTRDYVRKNGFSDVIIGLSGGVDSALVAAVAVDALGPEHVRTVYMPSRYSAQQSLDDAAQLAANLGMSFEQIGIEPAFEALLEMMQPTFVGVEQDVTEENMQARVRGIILMALSNKFGSLVLTTGNKSETSVGYCTLYGDMAGGFAPLKDVYKTQVYELCGWRNHQSEGPTIPESIITKPPTAELRPDQLDSDSLPAYEVLDPILKLYVEQDLSVAQIVEQGFEAETVRRVIRLTDLNEYKRRQAPPGVKVTGRAFGKDRRLPITRHL
ncbi:MAG: NAD+ synthase [Candidatus Alcyoniella australis]|nr:NAD+ synthase [Candidatus Alcyoniella australis]